MSEHSLIYSIPVSRATPLPPDERRRALIEATLPLLRTHGLATSTRQIAEAAGVAEGTIFRVFASKQALIDEAIVDAFSPDRLVATLADTAQAPDLERLLGELVAVLQEHVRDTRLLFNFIGHAARDSDDEACRRPDPAEMSRRVRAAVIDVLTPHTEALTVSPETAAGALIALSFGLSFAAVSGGDTPTPDQVTGVLLHGIAKEM